MNAPNSIAHLLPEVHQRPVPAAFLEALAARFGPEQLSTALAVREQHGRDESAFDVPPPAAVLFAQARRTWPTPCASRANTKCL